MYSNIQFKILKNKIYNISFETDASFSPIKLEEH